MCQEGRGLQRAGLGPEPGPDPARNPGPGRQILLKKHPGRVRAGIFFIEKSGPGPGFKIWQNAGL